MFWIAKNEFQRVSFIKNDLAEDSLRKLKIWQDEIRLSEQITKFWQNID